MENITTSTDIKQSVFFSSAEESSVRAAAGLDASEETQVEAGRDLDGLQSHGGGREDQLEGEDLLSVHHQGGRLLHPVFQKGLGQRKAEDVRLKKMNMPEWKKAL